MGDFLLRVHAFVADRLLLGDSPEAVDYKRIHELTGKVDSLDADATAELDRLLSLPSSHFPDPI